MQAADGTMINVVNVGVLVLSDSHTAAGAADAISPVHGQEGRQDIALETLHAHFNHRPHRCLSMLTGSVHDMLG